MDINYSDTEHETFTHTLASAFILYVCVCAIPAPLNHAHIFTTVQRVLVAEVGRYTGHPDHNKHYLNQYIFDNGGQSY